MDEAKKAMQRASWQARPQNQDEERARWAWAQNVKIDPSMPSDRFAFEHPDGRRDEFWTCCLARTSGPHSANCDRRPRLVR